MSSVGYDLGKIFIPGKIYPYKIIAPLGAFGNHIRWLILLDPKFNFLYKLSEQNYNNMAGPNWPTYSNYLINNWSGIDTIIKNEVIESTNDINFITIDDKLNFINSRVYYPTRSWTNWLKTEWTYREDLNQIIQFSHQRTDLTTEKILIFNIDPELAFKYYFKFNNKVAVECYSKFSEDHNDPTLYIQCSHRVIRPAEINSNLKVLDADILYQPQLDYNLYQNIINWFDLEDLYFYANQIHQTWWQLHQTATADFVKYVNTIYSSAK